MPLAREPVDRILNAVRKDRLLATATDLVSVPSRTGEAGVACDRLAEILERDGFRVERPPAGHSAAPAVVARLDSGRPGKILQWDGHLDTVHLPFVPPKVDGDLLTGSGASDMKGGVAAAVEALRALRDSGVLASGSVLLTAHDLHEAPWGLGQQLDRMIADGIRGDAVMIPEPLCDRLSIAGRGASTWKVVIQRSGPPVHEVMRSAEEPSVIAAGARFVEMLLRLDRQLATKSDPVAGAESAFVGQIHSGEIYNQYPKECWLEGTRRWLPGTHRSDVESELRGMADELARVTRTQVSLDFRFIRDAFRLDTSDPLVAAFRSACTASGCIAPPEGPKPFVDDGNSFWGMTGMPAITHGPKAGGQHTVSEWVSIDDLVRVARVYALTALLYC